MRKAIVALFLITAILLLSIRQERETIIIYSSMEQFRGEELQKQLNEQFPDLHAMVMYVPTAKAAAKIYVEKDQSDADIIVGLESSYMEKIKEAGYDVTTPMIVTNSDDYQEIRILKTGNVTKQDAVLEIKGS